MSHKTPGIGTNFTGKHDLTPKEAAAQRRMKIEIEYILDTKDFFTHDL
jgi:hypothetical protein